MLDFEPLIKAYPLDGDGILSPEYEDTLVSLSIVTKSCQMSSATMLACSSVFTNFFLDDYDEPEPPSSVITSSFFSHETNVAIDKPTTKINFENVNIFFIIHHFSANITNIHDYILSIHTNIN